jgi:hypothetical protein
MSSDPIKALTEGEPKRVRSDMGSDTAPDLIPLNGVRMVYANEPEPERHHYPELGLRRYDGCDLATMNCHRDAMDWFVSELDAASRGLGNTDPTRFVGAVHRHRVQRLLDAAWDDLARGPTPEAKLGAQNRIDYLARILGRFDAQKGNPYLDPRVVDARRSLLRKSAELKEADALKRWA